MKTTIALIIEPSDFTKDGNIKREAFEAVAKHDLVICAGQVFKFSPACAPVVAQEPVKRQRRRNAPEQSTSAPQPPVEPQIGQPTEPEEASGACVMGGSSAY